MAEIFGSIKTSTTELFNDQYVALSNNPVVVATEAISAMGIRGERSIYYWDFDNTNPLKFYGVRDPNITMRWIFDVEGCLFTCSCLAEQKVRFP